jgi:hypothetical protein
MRRVVGILVALAGLVIVGMVALKAFDGTLTSDLSPSILRASLGTLLLAFGAWFFFNK